MNRLLQTLQASYPTLAIATIHLPTCHSLNDMWVNYGLDGIRLLLNESVVEKQKNMIKHPPMSVVEVSDEVNKFIVHHEHKISYQGKTGMYYVYGQLPVDLSNMRITLHIEETVTKRKHRTKIDLSEAKQVENYCQELSEKEGLNITELLSDVEELLRHLEKHIDTLAEENQSNNKRKQLVVPLSLDKKTQAKAILSQPNLIHQLDTLIAQSGIIGEDSSRKMLFIIASTYKMENPLHALVQATSGAGKSHLINSIAACFPQEDILNLSRITSKSLYYYPKEELLNKLVLVQDIDGLDDEAQLAFRELQSAKILRSSTVHKDRYGNLQSMIKIVTAHFASMVATTKAEIYYDNMSRSIVVGVDESDEQTQRIIHYQNQKLSGRISQKEEQQAKEALQNVIRLLQPYEVINYYADKVFLPVQAKMLRRLNSYFQSFVAQITLLHQYQREKDQQGRLITQKEDLQQAAEILFDAIILKVDELDNATRQFYERVKSYVKQQATKEYTFTQREIRHALNQSKTQCFRFMDELTKLEYIQISDGSANRGFRYRIAFWDDMGSIKTKIKTDLLQQIDKL